MIDNTFFQLFILLDVFVIGILATVATRHLYAHFNNSNNQTDTHHSVVANEHLPATVRDNLLKASQDQFQAMLDHSLKQLQHNLEDTTEQINTLTKRLATEVVSSELEKYRTDLAKLHDQSEKNLGEIKKDMDSHQADLKNKVTEELEAEKQRLIKQIDTKLSDAVGSFLVETLQHNVDLGSQDAYLVSVLEEHKADFIKEVSDEA